MLTRACHWAEFNPFPTLKAYSCRTLPNVILHLRLNVPVGHFSLEFAALILDAFLITPLRANCLAHLIIFRLIALITSGESKNYEEPDNAIFSTLLLLPFS